MTFLGHGGELFLFNISMRFPSMASHTACAFLETTFLNVLHFVFLYFCHFVMNGSVICQIWHDTLFF